MHIPVLLEEAFEFLRCSRGGMYVDCTAGTGGHSGKILQVAAPEVSVIGIDIDAESLACARKKLACFGNRFTGVRGDYKELPEILDSLGVNMVDGILVDLGLSSYQLSQPSRGFSFQADGPLDMRFDQTSTEKAEKLVNELPEQDIRRILKDYGQERLCARIARLIVQRRTKNRIERTSELAEIAMKAYGSRKTDIHPATRTFQAFRIAVNRELEGLGDFIKKGTERLKEEGRFVAISFHSLEDRIVKTAFRDLSSPCICPPRLPVCGCGRKKMVTVLTRKPVLPSPEELERNPRARSAKLRAVERI